MTNNNILVTGGAGYIGSQTCKLLSQSGFNPISFDNLSTGHKELALYGPLIVGDLRENTHITECLEKYSPTAVIHFAGSAYVGESVTNPLMYYENNVASTISLLKAMKSANIHNIVFSSSCATYGIANENKIVEHDRQLPINPYGRSKLMVESILKDLANQNLINQISLRYFNAAGADKDGEIGEKHEPETHLIPLAIASAKSDAILKIFGDDFNTPDGTAIRDYTHVEDIGRAHILALEMLMSDKSYPTGISEFFNLGTGCGHSVLEIVMALRELGVSVKTTQANRRQGDPARLVADNSKAKKILKWEPDYQDIKSILTSAVAWHSKSP